MAGTVDGRAGSSGRTMLLYTVYFIYFFCGLTMCFEGVFLPEFKEYFGLSYQQQMYTMFAKNVPFLIALPIGYLLRYIGYKRSLVIAMALFAGGTLMLIPALDSHRYGSVLAAFFLIGIGFNFELVAGNPLLAALGPTEGASSRLNLGNALGAVAQIIAPATLSALIPAATVAAAAKVPYMQRIFLVLGSVLAVVAVVTSVLRNVDVTASFRDPAAKTARGEWDRSRAILGFIAIFLVLGVEAGLFGFYRNFLEEPSIAGLSAPQSQRMFTLYFGVFALGRLIASRVQKRMRPARQMLVHLAGAATCLALAVWAKGTAAVIAVTAIGFFVSIFFPTLYAIAIAGMGERTGRISGLLTMGFVGCALIPVLQGRIADGIGLQASYAIGFTAYAFAAAYTWRYR